MYIFNLFRSRLFTGVFVSFFAIAMFGCATKSQNVQVYKRDDVNTTNSKIVVFPMLLARGDSMAAANTSYSNPAVDALLGKNWFDALGEENVVVIPKAAFDKVPNAYEAMTIFVKFLDSTSAIEQSDLLSGFIDVISNQFGDGAIALALVFENEDEYEATGELHFNMGLFDTKSMTWKWITKTVVQKPAIPVPYQTALMSAIKDSYTALQSENAGQVR